MIKLKKDIPASGIEVDQLNAAVELARVMTDNERLRQQVQALNTENDALLQRVKELEREVDYLRRYGNKDCTAMADAAMGAER